MQAWKILTAILVVAAIPMVHAATPDGCDAAPMEDETTEHPLLPGKYLLLTPEGIEMWSEANGLEHLQIAPCVADDGSTVYDPDVKDDGIRLL